MGVGGISIWQLLIVLLIVVLLFGTKKLRNIGGDLGGAIKTFRKSMKEEGEAEEPKQIEEGQEDTEEDGITAHKDEEVAAQRDKA